MEWRKPKHTPLDQIRKMVCRCGGTRGHIAQPSYRSCQAHFSNADLSKGGPHNASCGPGLNGLKLDANGMRCGRPAGHPEAAWFDRWWGNRWHIYIPFGNRIVANFVADLFTERIISRFIFIFLYTFQLKGTPSCRSLMYVDMLPDLNCNIFIIIVVCT